MKCDICNNEINEIEEIKFVCASCVQKLKERNWWEEEGRKKLLEIGKKMFLYKKKYEESGKFTDLIMNYLREKGFMDDFLEYLKNKAMVSVDGK